MTERSPQQSPQTPHHVHSMREFLALDAILPSQVALLERLFDRIEKGPES